MYVTENGGLGKGTIRQIDLQRGTITLIAGNYSDSGAKVGPALSSNMDRPTSTTLDKAGNLYISDKYYNRFLFLDMTSMQMSIFVGSELRAGFLDGPLSIARFALPRGLAFDSKDNIYTIDRSAKVRKIADK